MVSLKLFKMFCSLKARFNEININKQIKENILENTSFLVIFRILRQLNLQPFLTKNNLNIKIVKNKIKKLLYLAAMPKLIK